MWKILFLALSLIVCSFRSIHGSPWISQNQQLFQRQSKIHCPIGYTLVNDGQGERCALDGHSKGHSSGYPRSNHRGFDFIFANHENEPNTRFNYPTTTTTTTTPSPFAWEPQPRRSDKLFDVSQRHYSSNEYLHHGSFGIALPQEDDRLSRSEMECLQKEQVYWPQDRECYPFLQQGPCQDHEWLVMREKPNSVHEVEIHCQKRPCPCHAKDPLLCEVWYEDSNTENCNNKCRVALAAEQDGICGTGEQLLLNPYGRAICGCRGDPVHMRSSIDFQCHPIGFQGPCPSNETLEFVPSLNKAVCLPSLCPPDMVLHPDSGRCFRLHTQGPCAQDSELVMDSESKQVSCHLRPGQVRKRVFDLAPSNPLRESRNRELLLGKLRVQMSDCSVNRNAIQCQDQDRTKKLESRPMLVGLDEKMRMMQDRLREQETRARGFLRWLWSFSRR